MHRYYLILGLLLSLVACTATSLEGRRETADRLARANELVHSEIETASFTFTVYSRLNISDEATIYIEGDGFAYVTPNKISPNPTPLRPIALDLASGDKGRAVIYLARPCQYVDLKVDTLCAPKYWSSHRFSSEIISAYQEALDSIKSTVKANTLHLVGYSGGGAVAVLIAAERQDIGSVRTLAGYLDHVALNEEMGVAPLTGSLDPIEMARFLEGIPQIHFAGGRDRVIPSWVVKNFVKAVNDPRCARFINLESVSHERGWVRQWARIGAIRPTC